MKLTNHGRAKKSYEHAVEYLYALQKYGIKLGLDNTIRLLSLVGSPQNSFKSIHIAGTNGKGSVSAMIASVLKTAGFSTGLFTSPHLINFTERIQVNNIEIKETEVTELTNEISEVINNQTAGVRDAESALNPTFFEFAAAMAFLYFKRKGIAWAVAETGMGGRLDATNVLMPEVSVITKISYDHKEFLGQSLREIAIEKAGIIKENVPVVSSEQEQEAMEIIMERADKENARIFIYGRDFNARPGNISMHGTTFDYEGRYSLKGLYSPLCGMHQMENAAVAVKAVELAAAKALTGHNIKEGLSATIWPGRLELIKKPGGNFDILIDGAHNPAAAKALSDAVREYFAPFYKGIILVLGIMSDKDIGGIMEPLLPLASEVILTAPAYERAASPSRLSEYAGFAGFDARVAGSVRESMAMAEKIAAGYGNNTHPDSRALILVTGSFYTIGEAKTALGQQGQRPSFAGLR